MNTPANFMSVGRAACELGVPADVIRLAAQQLSMDPALTLNHVEHYSAEQLSQLATAVEKVRSDFGMSLRANGLR